MILLTGVAGFIGMHLARRLLAEGQEVVGIDTQALRQAIGWTPATPLRIGIARFVEWFQRHGACHA